MQPSPKPGHIPPNSRLPHPHSRHFPPRLHVENSLRQPSSSLLHQREGSALCRQCCVGAPPPTGLLCEKDCFKRMYLQNIASLKLIIAVFPSVFRIGNQSLNRQPVATHKQKKYMPSLERYESVAKADLAPHYRLGRSKRGHSRSQCDLIQIVSDCIPCVSVRTKMFFAHPVACSGQLATAWDKLFSHQNRYS